MHFAAFAYVGESMSKPQLYFNNNLVKTLACSMPCSLRRPAHRLLLDLRDLRHARAHAITEDTPQRRSILMARAS